MSEFTGSQPLRAPDYWGKIVADLNKIYVNRVIHGLNESFGPLQFIISATTKTATLTLQPTDPELLLKYRALYADALPNYVCLPLMLDFLMDFSITSLHMSSAVHPKGFPFGMILEPSIAETVLPARKEDGNMQLIRLTRTSIPNKFVSRLHLFRNLGSLRLIKCMMTESITMENMPYLTTLHLSIFAVPQSNARCIVDVSTLPRLDDVLIDTRGRVFEPNSAPMVTSHQIFYTTQNSLANVAIINGEHQSLKRMHVLINWADVEKVPDVCVFHSVQKFEWDIEARDESFSYIRTAHDVFFNVSFEDSEIQNTFAERISARTIVSDAVLYTAWAAILRMQPVVLTLGPLVPFILGLCDPPVPLKGAVDVNGTALEVKQRMAERKNLLKKNDFARQPILILMLTKYEKTFMDKWLRSQSLETRRGSPSGKTTEYMSWTPTTFKGRAQITDDDMPKYSDQKWMPDMEFSVLCILNQNFVTDYPSRFVK